MTNIFQSGDFALNSGAHSSWKLECDALTDQDITTLAEMIRILVGPFCGVEGVPRGGSKLAEACMQHLRGYGPHLIVDDVLTSGGSMERARVAAYQRDGVDMSQRPHYVAGVVLFARGRCPDWISAVFQMPECFWIRKGC